MITLWPDDWPDSELRNACAAIVNDRDYVAFLHLPSDVGWTDWLRKGNAADDLPRYVALLIQSGPLHPAVLLDWREQLSQLTPPRSLTFIRLPADAPAAWHTWLGDAIRDFGVLPTPEPVALEVGSLVALPNPSEAKTPGSERGYEPYVLAVPPDGRLAPVLACLDSIRRTFAAMRPDELEKARLAVQGVLDTVLRDPADPDTRKKLRDCAAERFAACNRTRLPRVLLLGESGTGKTVLARYLATHERDDIPFDRVPVPEYLGREDSFELDVFGYCKSAYTGALDEGDRGHLGEQIGGVIFFDEIGDANPTIQAKLLAYLDDYIVKPRGLTGRGYYAPTLVVAATNRDVFEEKNPDGSERIRHDLLNRFNEVIHVPSLTDRNAELDLQVDLLLQQEASSSALARDRPIRQVGRGALDVVQNLDFTNGNFRLLERVLSTACTRARSERRDYLVKDDLTEPE